MGETEREREPREYDPATKAAGEHETVAFPNLNKRQREALEQLKSQLLARNEQPTLRDQFAMAIVPSKNVLDEPGTGISREDLDEEYRWVCEEAYRFADAMLEARKK